LTTGGLLVLQREGTGPGLVAHVGLGRIGVFPGPGGEWVAEVSAAVPERASFPSREAACAEAAAFAQRLVGFPVAPAPFVAAGVFAPDAPASAGDRVVSPLRYDPGTDTVRALDGDHPVAAFPGGAFARAELADDTHARPYLTRALEAGFGPAARARSDAHCKRLLAWLAGADWLADAHGPLLCGVLRPDMTLEEAERRGD
jgi:hypothetical protein